MDEYNLFKEYVFFGISDGIANFEITGDISFKSIPLHNIYYYHENLGVLTQNLDTGAYAQYDMNMLKENKYDVNSLLKEMNERLLLTIAMVIDNRTTDKTYVDYGKPFQPVSIEYWDKYIEIMSMRNKYFLLKHIKNSYDSSYSFVKEFDAVFSFEGYKLEIERIFIDIGNLNQFLKLLVYTI